MNKPVRFKPAAERDVESVFAWYGEQRKVLARNSSANSRQPLFRVTANPFAHQKIRGRIRRAVIHRFPYLVFYVIDREEIVVLAVFHASRDPQSWPSQAREDEAKIREMVKKAVS